MTSLSLFLPPPSITTHTPHHPFPSNTETTAQQMMVEANIPLAEMFGYSTTLRSSTQGIRGLR
jgi:hypothetical protein